MLQAIELSKHYGDHVALDCLNLTVDPGELFCLLGGNGAGKSTTIKLFMDFVSATSGSALVNGIDVAKQPSLARSHLAYIPEIVNLYPYLTGLENLKFFTELTGREFSRDELELLLAQVTLPMDAIRKPVRSYSKGMRQKVGIAIAIAKQAKALLLDEPTSGLDPAAANQFSEILLQLRSQGMAILMATHDLFRARDLADRIGVMAEGSMVEVVSGNEVSHQELEELYLRVFHAAR